MSSPATVWAGRILSGLPALMLLMSGVMKLMKSPELVDGFGKLGWPPDLATPLGILEIAVTVVYLVPRTAVLGAILVTGYLGGAIATHVRLHEPFIVQFLLGAAAWGGLYFREERLRALIPFKR